MDVETVFRATFGIKKEQDMVGLIEAAVSVASLIVPEKLKKHRSRIVKLLFDENPANSTDDFFSEDELGFDSDDDEELLKATSTPAAKNPSHSPKIKKLGFKKSLEKELSAPQKPLMMVGRQEKSIEATKKVMLGRKYPEEAEKKRKLQHVVDFAEPKKHCSHDESLKVTSTPAANNTSYSLKIQKLGFKKSLEEELSAPQMPLMMVGRQDKLMYATKKMLGRKHPKEEEEAEKKAAKKRKIDFPQPKKHCDGRSKAKPPSGHVRQRTATFKNELKAQHAKPKPKCNY